MRKLKICMYIFFCVFFLQTVAGQEELPTALLYFADISAEPVDETITKALVDRVVEEVVILDFLIDGDPIVTYQGESSGALEDARLSSTFSDISAEDSDIIIATFYTVQGSSIYTQYILYDPDTEIGVGGGSARARVGVTLFSTINDAVLSLSTYLEEYLRDRYTYEARRGRVEEIAITGEQEGIQIFLASRYVGDITSGDLVVPYTPLKIGSFVTMELRKEGYHNRSFNIPLNDPRVSVDLPNLWREKRLALQTFWTLGLAKGVGFGFKTYFIPDNTFAYLGLHIHDSQYDSPNVNNISLNYDFSFLLGQYILFPPESFFRLSIGLGLGVIKTTVVDAPDSISDYNDVYVNMGSPTIELNFGPVQIFVRGELKYLLGVGDQILGRNWLLSPIGIPPISFGVQAQW